MSQLPPVLLSLLEGKNAELKQHHLDARIGDLQGSRVQAVRDVLDEWAPREGTPLYELWLQVKRATELYTDEIDRIRKESYGAIPGVFDPDYRSGDDG
jgi:hypothetical protein